MRERIKKTILPVLCVAAMLAGLSVPAFAEPDPNYTGEVDSFPERYNPGAAENASEPNAAGEPSDVPYYTYEQLPAYDQPAGDEVDPFYTGEIDSFTGKPIAIAEEDVKRVLISGTMFYDKDLRMYVFPTLFGDAEVHSNVVDGMIVSEPVSISADEGVELSISRNGVELENVNFNDIQTPGDYQVFARNSETASFVTLFTFTIVGARSIMPGGYVMPEDFYILDATLEGEETLYERNYIGMGEEGLYEVEYICADTARHYKLTTIVDRTPPEITLSGTMDEEGRYHSAVQINGLQNGDTIIVTRDGEPATISPNDWRLPEAGMYYVQVFDAAGNSTVLQFTILAYFDFNSLLFFALVCVSVVGVVVYIYLKRKKLKIA